MTASADKVQFLLESSLEQTLPLVKKGIFTEQQLRQIMLERQKHQNKLYSSTYKLSHYLKAIQFQYDLQRQRQYKIKYQDQENVNPLFKKQGKTDFSIVKRIIKLWDRTMHKYRYRTYLWKQYLSFCILIKSKKHFYKALTNALRFLPFQLELWKIGVRYEVEIGTNMWKARKLFHKALKLVPSGEKNISITKDLIKFQLEFVQNLQSRQKIIQGQKQEGQNNMKFITGENNSENQSESQNQGHLIPSNITSQLLKLKQYHEVLYVALLDSINKNFKSKNYFSSRPSMTGQQRCESLCNIYLSFLNDLNQNQENQLLNHVLLQTMQKIQAYKQSLSLLKIEDNFQQQQDQMQVQENNEVQEEKNADSKDNNELLQQAPEHCLLIEEGKRMQEHQTLRQLTKQQKYSIEMLENYRQTSKFNEKLFTKVIKQFCLKPLQLGLFLEPLLEHFLTQILAILSKNQWLRIPLKILALILAKLNNMSQQQSLQSSQSSKLSFSYSSYFCRQFQKINSLEYQSNIELLRQTIIFNRLLSKIEENNKLYRSLLVNCKKNIEFIERAKCLFNQ